MFRFTSVNPFNYRHFRHRTDQRFVAIPDRHERLHGHRFHFLQRLQQQRRGLLGRLIFPGIAALQNISAGTNVTFRIVLWGGTSSSVTWYIYDVTNSTVVDFAVQGTVTPALSPIQSWRQQWFGTTANSGAAADNAVATSDRMPNLLKYARWA